MKFFTLSFLRYLYRFIGNYELIFTKIKIKNLYKSKYVLKYL